MQAAKAKAKMSRSTTGSIGLTNEERRIGTVMVEAWPPKITTVLGNHVLILLQLRQHFEEAHTQSR